LLCNSLRRTDNQRIGFNTRMPVTIHRISGFQQMESKIFRQADGVGAEYEARSTLASGLVKQAYSPDILRCTTDVGMIYRQAY